MTIRNKEANCNEEQNNKKWFYRFQKDFHLF